MAADGNLKKPAPSPSLPKPVSLSCRGGQPTKWILTSGRRRNRPEEDMNLLRRSVFLGFRPQPLGFSIRHFKSLGSTGELLDGSTSPSLIHGIHVFHCPVSDNELLFGNMCFCIQKFDFDRFFFSIVGLMYFSFWYLWKYIPGWSWNSCKAIGLHCFKRRKHS